MATKRPGRTNPRPWTKKDFSRAEGTLSKQDAGEKISVAMKRTIGALRQKALILGLPLGHRR
jgi:hypothetical protein